MADSNSPNSVLFVCNMNQIRSPMAEFLTRNMFGDRIYAQSAGIMRGDEDGFMQAVMSERNIDVSEHHPETLEELDDHFVDLVVILSRQAHDITLDFFRDEAINVEVWETPNPSVTVGRRDEVLGAYRKTRDDLEEMIKKRFS